MPQSRLPLLSPALFLAAGLLFSAKLPAQPPTDAPQIPPTVRVYSREVVVDINVNDAQGNFVHGLTRNDFTILEDGKPMIPSSFREHRYDQNAQVAPTPTASLPPNTFTNVGQPEGARPLNMLLLDSLDTPIMTQSVVRRRLVDFVDKLAPGTPVAVFALSTTGELTLVQGFTTDPDLLKKALKSNKLNLQVPPLEDFGLEPNDNASPGISQNGKAVKMTRPEAVRVDLNMECNHIQARGQYTYAALSQIARYVSGMPGRKNLIWYTGLFPTGMRDKQGTECVDFREQSREVAERLGRSHVVLYPVDPRALDILARDGPDSRISRLVTVEDLRMQALADDSGGKAFYNNNDLTAAAMQAVEAGSNYYTIAYTPPNQNLDSRLRSVSITVDRPDTTLVYRRNYHATPPGQTVSGQVILKATSVETSMLRGALQPTEILFHVAVDAAAAPETSLLPGNNADPKAMKPPYRHLTLSYLIDLNGIQFDPSVDGNYHGQFEYAVNVYNPADGRLLNSSALAAKPSLPPAAYQSLLASGAKLRQEIDVPATGEYVLRIGIHDLTTDRVGAIEIPASALHP